MISIKTYYICQTLCPAWLQTSSNQSQAKACLCTLLALLAHDVTCSMCIHLYDIRGLLVPMCTTAGNTFKTSLIAIIAIMYIKVDAYFGEINSSTTTSQSCIASTVALCTKHQSKQKLFYEAASEQRRPKSMQWCPHPES